MSYRDLKSYQNTVIIYDFTVKFCELHISCFSRTRDQMNQAARSGKQNIAEGSTQRASKKSEIKLIGVARASLQELLEDYEDFLRQHGFKKWAKEDPRAMRIRALAYKSNKSYETYKTYIKNPEVAANAMICLISQTTYLLDRQISVLEQKFLRDGGYTENLFKRRLKNRFTAVF